MRPARLPLSLAAATTLAIAALAVPHAASAAIHRNTSAGGACHPAVSGSTAFTYGNNFIWNRGTTYQYVVCHLTQLDFGTDALIPTDLTVFVQMGPVETDGVTCTAQYGVGPSTTYSASVTSTWYSPANTGGQIEFDMSRLSRPNYAYALTLNCKVPGGGKLGLIRYTEPEPSSGTAWTP